MLFSDTIPNLLSEHPNVARFSAVLDGLQEYKKENIFKALRVHNPSILMDKKWLLRQLEEYGVTGIPLDYPIQPLQQYLLNVDTICGLRGSKIGLELLCSVLTLGEVTVNDEDFFTKPTALILDSPTQAFLSSSNDKEHFFLVEDSSDINKVMRIDITIKSKFFSFGSPHSKIVEDYVRSSVEQYLGFSPNRQIFILHQLATDTDNYYFHELLNPYFV